MNAYLETTVDKFTFRVAPDRWYTPEGLWVLPERDGTVRIGVSDAVQQRSGDVAFVELPPAGTTLSRDEPLGTIETIKVNLELACPVSGTIVEINPDLERGAEAINLAPYEEGWLVRMAPQDWAADQSALLEAQAYFERMKAEIAKEMRQ